VIIEFPDRVPYTVRIGGGVAAQLGADLRAAGVEADRCAVLCDSDGATRCLPALKQALAAEGFRVADIAVPAVAPEQAWECVGELHQAFAQLGLPDGAPIIVCAGVDVAQLAAFAVETYGAGYPLVVVPASLASALRTVGVETIEADAGHAAPVVVPARLSYAAIDASFLASATGEEAAFGLDELEMSAAYCDDEYRMWQSENAQAIADGDEEALVLALTHVLAARADFIGFEISERLG
jgi:3-dehydroquinate synthetase